MVVLSVDVWHKLWREQVIDDIALTRITVITEISDLSITSEKLSIFFLFQPITSFLTLKPFHSLVRKTAFNLFKKV